MFNATIVDVFFKLQFNIGNVQTKLRMEAVDRCDLPYNGCAGLRIVAFPLVR